MSEDRGVARWSEDAVGMINWDNTAKEGTAQVTDETTGTVYQIGGGGESDFSTAQVTFVNTNTVTGVPFICNDPEFNLLGTGGVAFQKDLPTLTVVLYKGHCYILGNDQLEISGNITYDSDAEVYDITGDCTITYGSTE